MFLITIWTHIPSGTVTADLKAHVYMLRTSTPIYQIFLIYDINYLRIRTKILLIKL